MRHEGLIYRALNPLYAREPLSGEGTARFGGRFNRVGMPALYCSLEPDTAIREANQVGMLQPTTLVALRADVGPLFDGRDEPALAAYSISVEALADPAWRETMLRGRNVPTQNLGARLMKDGFAGIIVPSYAKGAPAGAANLVLWRWNEGGDCMVRVIDDEGRLGRLEGEPGEEGLLSGERSTDADTQLKSRTVPRRTLHPEC